jgi:hypothetical protein
MGEDKRQVSREQAKQLMKALNIQDFFEVSVKDNVGIDDVFLKGLLNCADI